MARRRLDRSQIPRRYPRSRDLAISRHPTLPFMPRAYELRADVTTYDAAYIGLAEALGCVLLTADARLATAPGPRCEIWILDS